MDELDLAVGPEECGPSETQGCGSCPRPFSNEPKIPYVRLERLKICAASSGEMPVFKLKPQKNDQDGSFLLIIECGAESSSMSIKVPLFSAFSLKLAPVQEPLFSLCSWQNPSSSLVLSLRVGLLLGHTLSHAAWGL